MNAYFISGLGVDERIFSRLKLNENIKIIHLNWITPADNDSIESYARKLRLNIDLASPFILVGVSFGGMVAVEISKFLNPIKTIIISSTISYKQIPLLFRLAGKLNIHELIPIKLFKSVNSITYFLFGIKEKSEKRMLINIIEDTDPYFLKWAINSILTWKNEVKPQNIFHIHGDNDRILPNYSKADYVIKDGTHLMIYQKAREVSVLINKLL